MSFARRVVVNTGQLAAGRVFIAAAGILGTAVATRQLGTGDFAALTVALGFVAILTLVTDLGLWQTAAREIARTPERREAILGNTAILGLGLTLVAALAGAALTLLLYGGADREGVRIAIAVLGLQLLVAAPGGIAGAYLSSEQRAGPILAAGLVSSAVFLVVLGLAVALDGDLAAIAAAYLAAGLLNLLVPAVLVRDSLPRRPRLDPVLARQVLRWALPQSGVLIVGVLYFRIGLILLSLLAVDAETAVFGLSSRVTEVLTLLPSLFMFTFFPAIARAQPHSGELAALVQSALSSMLLVVVPLVLVFAGFAGPVVAVIGGRAFEDAAAVLELTVLAVGLGYFNTVLSVTLVALGRPGRLLALLTAALGVNVLLNLLLIPDHGAVGAAVALVVSEVLALVLSLGAYARVGALPRLRRPGRTAMAIAVAAVPAVLVAALGPDPRDAAGGFALVAAGGAATVALWVGALHLLRAIPPEVAAALGPALARLPLRSARPEGPRP